MKFAQRFLMGMGGLGLLAAAGLLVAPRPAHAIAAALVDVVNTTSAPAITQDVSQLASSAAAIFCEPSLSGMCLTQPSGNPFAVPAGKSFVITAVDMEPSAQNYTLNCGTSQYHFWSINGAEMIHFVYPNGLVLPAGCVPTVIGTPTAPIVQLTGFLTSN